MLLPRRLQSIVAFALCIVLSCSSQLEQDKFAGNLEPEDSRVSDLPTPVSNSNLTEQDGVVHVVSPSVDTPASSGTPQDKSSTSTVQDKASTGTVQDKSSTVQDESSTVQDESSTAQDESSTAQDESSTAQDESSTVQDESSTVQDELSVVQDKPSTVQDKSSTVQDKAGTGTVQDKSSNDTLQDESNTNDKSSTTQRPRKAPRPVAKPESVGFVPPPDEQEKEEAVEQVPANMKKVQMISSLPTSIIKPGRMSNGSWFIVLYAPWCVHSQAALAEFLQVIQYAVDKNMSRLVAGKIDVVKHGDVAKHFRVKGIPTIMFFQEGMRYTFDHPNVTAANLIDFMLAARSAHVSPVNSTAGLAELQKNHSVLFLIVHDEELDSDWHSIYMKQARDKALRAKFAYTTNPDIVSNYNLKSIPSIMVLKDDTAFVFRGTLTSYALSKWILTEKHPAFPAVNLTNLRAYLKPVSGRKVAFLVVNDNPKKRSSSETKAIEVIRSLAISRKHHSNFQFGLIEGSDIPETIFRRPIESCPLFFVLEPYTGYYYLFQPGKERGQISEETIAKFLRGVISGEEERLGGATLMDRVYYLYLLGNGMVQSMIQYRPYLSMVTGVCVLGVFIFYAMVCCQSRGTKLSPAEVKARKAARAQKRKEELAKREAEATRRRIEAKEKAVAKTRDSASLRKRNKQPARAEREESEGTASQSDDAEGDYTSSGSEGMNSQTER